MKNVIITGATGQDGSLMSDYLLSLNEYNVFGIAKSHPSNTNLELALKNSKFELICGDITDSSFIYKIFNKISPCYFINFASSSSVNDSWLMPYKSLEVETIGVLNILEAIKNYKPKCRAFFSGSSEEFGSIIYTPQTEKHPLKPKNPYGAAKCASRHLVNVYRESYGLYVVQGWLYNHDSIRRNEKFVTRKITKGVARISKNLEEKQTEFNPIELGNIYSERDISDASDFIDAIWRMLNQEVYNDKINPILITNENIKRGIIKDYIVSSGERHSIIEFVELAFKAANISGKWMIDNRFIILDNYVATSINPLFYRPIDTEVLVGDASLIKNDLKWSPKTSFNELIDKMVKNDIKLLEN